MNRFKKSVIALTLSATMLSGFTTVRAEESHVNVATFMWMEGLDPGEGWNGWTTMRCGIAETLLTANRKHGNSSWLADSWKW